jgi:thioesterase domain-containing protein
MSDAADLEDLVAYLVRTSRLDRAQAARLVDEVLAVLDETPEDFIRRRHRALQAEGLSNEAIFARISAELPRRRFRAPDYTPRQIRRIIYG